MKRTFVLVSLMAITLASMAEGSWLVEQRFDSSNDMLSAPTREDMVSGCPSLPSAMYPDISYNVGAIPWKFEFSSTNFGDLTGATIQWYRWDSRWQRGGATLYPDAPHETKADAVPYYGPGYNTVDSCYAATDEGNSWYDYFVVITKPGCAKVESAVFNVQVGRNQQTGGLEPCMTYVGTTFTMNTKDGQYNVGATITLKATNTAYGGDKQYTWYHNGEPIDTTDHVKYTLTWGFNNPQLTINNATLQDGGTYSISMQDGTECVLYTQPVRIQVGDHQCGTAPSLSVQKPALAEGETSKVAVSNATLEAGETGEWVFMLQPDGSNPTITGTSLSNMTFSADMPGTYNFKYVIKNPTYPSCYRESKVVSVIVYGCGPTPTITPSSDLVAVNNSVTFTTTGLGDFETGKVTTQKQGETTWTQTYPEGTATFYTEGEYTAKYTITNSKAASCNREVTTTVRVYHCGWGDPRFNNWCASSYKVGQSWKPTPSALPSANWTGVLAYTIDGGEPIIIDKDATIQFDQPGTYVVTWTTTHNWTDACTKTATKTFTVEPCGSKATLTTNKTEMKVGESATLTYNAAQSGETATLTYSKDGGAAQTQTGKTFTPTAPGTYVFTYTITKSGCGANSATVTIVVYECGPDATVAAPEYLKVNTSTTITTSQVGDYETGTLTVAKGTGTATTLTSTTWTPTSTGDYVIKWSVKHSKVDCDRSAQTTVHVIDCGTPADIQSNKTNLKLGESATLTLSAVSALETSTLTYSKDGGAPSTMVGTTFAPTSVGSYVLTYTVTNTKIDCETTDQITINVYDCGPDAEISTAKSTYNTSETVSINTSAIGTNEEGTLTYSKDGGAPVVIINYAAWAPPAEGTYVLTWTVKHRYIDCDRTATKTIKVSDCGNPADIEADKTTIKLGETVTLTLSAITEEGATGSVTCAKDGGTPAPFTGTIFTPTEVGQYEFKYVIENTTLGCQTEDVVTIGVYDCGPEATVAVSPVDIKLGDAAMITVSEVGDYETGTLTYSYNGATAMAATPGSWTAPAAGTYVFTWSVKHSKIACDRSSDPFTVNVYDCGVPAQIIAGKNILKEGETTTLTLSTVSAVETSTLTLSKDGGAAEPFVGTSFTPTAAGVYVFTYTVSHTKIDCETSAQVTIEVYGCGPEATIEATATEVKLLRTTTITVSEVGSHESGTLTYSYDGGAPVTIQPGVWQADQIGTYVFTWSIKHDKIDCARSASVTITVIEAELVFDDKHGTHVWSDPGNWWPTYKRIPHYLDSAILRAPCQVDIADAQTNDLTFDVTSGKPLTILPTGALTVNHLMIGNKAGDILVKADATGNGALVLYEENVNVSATVEFYARSKDRTELQTIWQYMGYPLSDQPLITNAYPKAAMYAWTNTPNRKLGGNWQRLDSLSGQVSPFSGYCMTEDKEQVYTFSGVLNDPVRTTVDVPYNDQGTYPGFAFISNSWVAPIDIARMEVSDFGAADATVYIMNTGTYFEALSQQVNISRSGQASARGQYNAIPVHAASYLAGSLSTIPPMQGFFVHTKAATQMVLDYPKAVFDAVGHRSTVNPTRSPARRAGEEIVPEVYRFFVTGFGAEDEVYVLQNEAFSTSFDNGWDGCKATSPNSNVRMAIRGERDMEYSVAAVPEIDGTSFYFDGGNHKTYTLLVECSDEVEQGLMIWDVTKDTYTPLVNGAEVRFKCGADPEQFRIVGSSVESLDEEEVIEKFIYNEVLYIRRGNQLYDACGRKLQ